MESSAAISESPSSSGFLPDQNSPFNSECLATALELLEVLREEAGILRQFVGTELLRLVPKKEFLVRELEWKLQSAKKAGKGIPSNSDSFRTLLLEIDRLNTSNGVFIKKALFYWQDLLSVLSPQSYGPTGKKAARPVCKRRGLSFEREI